MTRVSADAIKETARKIADDLRAQFLLRRRGDRRKLRPSEIEIMAAQERQVDSMIARRIQNLLRSKKGEADE